MISAAAEYSGKLITGKGFLANFKPTGKLYAKRFNDEVLPELANFNVHLEESFNKIVYSHDIETTLKAAGISYILYKLTSWFSLYTLIFIFVVLIFTVPVIYKTYKKEIDAAVADITKTIKTKSAEFTEKAHKAAGPHIDTLIKKTGPIGSFIQSNSQSELLVPLLVTQRQHLMVLMLTKYRWYYFCYWYFFCYC